MDTEEHVPLVSESLRTGAAGNLAGTPGGTPAGEYVSSDTKDVEPAMGNSRTLSESVWVSRAQDGDANAFTHLVRTYEGELFRLSYRMLSDRGEAQDVVQDVLVLMWRQLPTLDDPRAFRSWIYQIATRRCLNVLRGTDRQRTILTRGSDIETETSLDIQATPEQEDPAHVAQVSAAQRSLDQVLAGLPSQQRACGVLHHLHDLTYAQIAYAVGVPASTVRGRISRARQNLAKGMAAWQ